MGFLRHLLAQTRKELAQFLRDPLSVALSVLLPIMMLMIFGFGIRLEIHDIPFAVIDEDHTQLSRTIVERLVATTDFRLVAADPAHPERVLDAGTASGLLVIPALTQARVAAGQRAPLQVAVDGADVVNARIVNNYVLATVSEVNQLLVPVATPSGIAAATRIWFNPGRREALYIVPGVYAIVLGIFPTILAAIALVRDREEGTILQVYASAMNAGEYLSGKILAYTLIGLGEAFSLMVLGALIWGLVPVGDPTPLLICTPLYLLAVVCQGIAVGTTSSTQSGAVQVVAMVANLPAILFSGFLYPLENIPFPISLLSNIVPSRYYIAVTRDAFVRGSGWSGVWLAAPALGAFALVCFFLAWRKMRTMRLPG